MYQTQKSIKSDDDTVSYEAETNGSHSGCSAGIIFRFKFMEGTSTAKQIDDHTIEFEIVGNHENCAFRAAIKAIYEELWK